MHRLWGSWVVLLVLWPLQAWASPAAPSAHSKQSTAGTLDLRQHDFARQGPVALRGPWQVYWQKLLPPDALAQTTPTGTLPIPALWGKIRSLGGAALQTNGYATYRLRLKLKRPRVMALRLHRLYSSYRLYINGRLRLHQGKVGTSKAASSIHIQPRVVTFYARHTNDITIQISNFIHRKGGPAAPLLLGTKPQLSRDRTLRILFDVAVFAALLIIGLFYLLLHIMLRQSKATLYFALAGLSFGLRLTLVNESILLILFPQAPYPLLLRLEYVLTFAICTLAVMFMEEMFPKESRRWAVRGFQIVWGLLALIVLIMPLSMVSHTWWLILASMPLLTVYALFVLIQAFRKKREGARVLLLGNLLVLFGGAYDVWGYSGTTGARIEVTQLGFVVLIIGQALLLAKLFSNAFVTVDRLARELERKNEHLLFMNEAASRFVPDDLLVLLGKDNIAEVQLSDYVHKHMAIMFSDIRGFTTLSEQMTAAENFAFVNALMGRLSPIIRSHNGFVIKYLGDGIMAVFPGGVEDALAAANAKLAAVQEYNEEGKDSDQPFLKVGIGINYGSMMLGMVGELSRLQGDVLADAVNLAARVEGMTKRYQVDLLITDSAYQALHDPDDYHLRELDRVKPKGKSVPVTVYEVYDSDDEESIQGKDATRQLLQQAIHCYREQAFQDAIKHLERAQALDPHDEVLSLYIERCQRRIQEGKTADWDGVEVLKSK